MKLMAHTVVDEADLFSLDHISVDPKRAARNSNDWIGSRASAQSMTLSIAGVLIVF
jgi:hypothetical protein